MANYKCKMCGGALDVTEGQTIIKCDFCGTTQTVPTLDNEKKQSYFNRANNLRLKGEFDRAISFYEMIVAEFPQEAEAYWGLLLCKYGIEYVEHNGKRVPTCHRTQYQSIFDDPDYLSAIKYADVVARSVYESEATAINELQKGILRISSSKDPYDIFICYKETDKSGDRTADSVLATDIYKNLIKEGYKVFFSRITLEGKLGTEFEPYIFSALKSAKIMLHVTTSAENSNSVWVKNEWSRFLELLDGEKALIPCYKGIKASELPNELKNFQGQDFSKIGAMQDLLFGIEKIMKRDKQVCAEEMQEKAKDNEDDLDKEYTQKIFETDEIESFCYTASDIFPLIKFFEANAEYKEAKRYLTESKYQFIKHVNSYEDCELALLYIEELADYKDTKALASIVEDKKRKYREQYLQQKGYAVSIPTGSTAKELIAALKGLIDSEQQDETTEALDEYDRAIISQNRINAQSYVKQAMASLATSVLSLNELTEIYEHLTKLQNGKFGIKGGDSLLQELSLRIEQKKEEDRESAKKKKNRKILFILGIIVASIAIILSITIYVVVRNNGYRAENFSIRVTKKVNDKYNEELADGYSGAGYYYTFTFEAQNDSPHKITQLHGYMDINNISGNTLSTSHIELKGSLDAGAKGTWTVQLNVPKGDRAREIWNTDFSDLQITFRITDISFVGGTYKTYADTKNIIVHDFESD